MPMRNNPNCLNNRVVCIERLAESALAE